MDRLLITYSPLNDVRVEKALQFGETIYVGRDPGVDGIRLEDAEQNISRKSVLIELVERGVSIYNGNKYPSVLVELGKIGESLQSLRQDQTLILRSDGCIVIEGTHRIDFILDSDDIQPVRPDPGPDEDRTIGFGPQMAWEHLHENYKQVCIALVVAWHITDFKDIKYRTVPTNQQIAVLLNKTPSAVNKKIERTKEAISCITPFEFIGEHGKRELADWIDRHNLVTSEMLDLLPGLSEMPRRSKNT